MAHPCFSLISPFLLDLVLSGYGVLMAQLKGNRVWLWSFAMRYVIFGAGAVGGVIGGHLYRAGKDVTLVARGAHLAAIREHGLLLDMATGLETLRIPAAADASEVMWTPDTVVILCVKSHQTDAALDDLEAHAPRTTPIVSAQNGVANEAALLRRFPRTYSICVVLPATHLEPGVVVQDSSRRPGVLDIGRYPSGSDEVAEAIAADLRDATFASLARENIMDWKYRKLMRNLGNGIGASFAPGKAYDELLRLARLEGERVIDAAGISMVSDEADDARRVEHIARRPTRSATSGGSSTWQSVARGAGSVEIDYLAGEVVLLGRLHGVPTPVNELVQVATTTLARERRPSGGMDADEALAALGVKQTAV